MCEVAEASTFSSSIPPTHNSPDTTSPENPYGQTMYPEDNLVRLTSPSPRCRPRLTSARPQLVLCRHGQSLTNASNVFTGILDPPLTAHGEAEARDVGRFLAELPGGEPVFDVCFTSPLVRASRSAGIILETLEQAPETFVEDALLERNYGQLNGRSKVRRLGCVLGIESLLMFRLLVTGGSSKGVWRGSDGSVAARV